jgi:hypothetical protein
MVHWVDVLLSILSNGSGGRWWTRQKTSESESDGKGWLPGAAIVVIALIVVLLKVLKNS